MEGLKPAIVMPLQPKWNAKNVYYHYFYPHTGAARIVLTVEYISSLLNSTF